MRDARPSTTALWVAALRALATTGDEPLLVDAAALQMLPRSWALAVRLAGKSRTASGLLRGVPDLVSRGRLQHVALRTRAIDETVRLEVSSGAQQLVVLGAGFDTRAYRLAALAGVRVFELDHPATQREKCKLVTRLAPPLANVHFVPLDFERERLGAQLLLAGFDASLPSVFVWEGVTMYLTLTAIRRTLAQVQALTAPRSVLVASYYDASGASGPRSRSTLLLAALAGEPFRTWFEASEAAELVRGFGFVVETDAGRDAWARALGRAPRGHAQERVLVARRVGWNGSLGGISA